MQFGTPPVCVILDSGTTLILCKQSCSGHNKPLLVQEHILGIRARSNGSSWKCLHTGHEVLDVAFLSWAAFSTENALCPSALCIFHSSET